MTVYADVLIVVNYIINLLLLLASSKILGTIVARKRLCLASLTGALGALIIFFPYIGVWFQFLYKLFLTMAMTAVAFGMKSWRKFGKSVFVLFAVSFIFAGLMLLLSYLLLPVGLLFYNGVVYFDISAFSLIVCTGVAYLLLLILEKIFFSRKGEGLLYDLTVTTNGKTIALKGLVDSGNNLREPFSGAPVIVCDSFYMKKICPDSENGFRVIPCLTVTGEAALEAFHPDEVLIIGFGKKIHTSDVYIAASREPICGEYQALINPQIIDRA